MKASLVSMLVVTSVIKRLALDEMYDIELLFTPDEEIGSPISHAIIQERTKDAVGVFNMEPARPSGAIVTARKGSAHMRFDIDGKASHSGLAIEEGISAIDELAYKIIKIKELMDLDKGLTVNIGTVQGGTTNNTVAPNAMGTIHSGYRRIKDYENLKEQIQNIVNQSFVEGTKSRVEIGAMILPMEKTVKGKQMYEIVKESANLLGIPITETETKGAADAGFAASLGVPTICGMGPVGGKWHSTEEYLELDSFIPRMQLLAVSIILYSRFAK
jgi:glutamate carboxypeptidase